MVPFLSAKPFASMTAEEFHAYVKSLYREPPKAEPLADFTLRLSGKGGYVLTVRREPKWLTYAEALKLSREHGLNYQELLTGVRKRKITLLKRAGEAGALVSGETNVSAAADSGKNEVKATGARARINRGEGPRLPAS